MNFKSFWQYSFNEVTIGYVNCTDNLINSYLLFKLAGQIKENITNSTPNIIRFNSAKEVLKQFSSSSHDINRRYILISYAPDFFLGAEDEELTNSEIIQLIMTFPNIFFILISNDLAFYRRLDENFLENASYDFYSKERIIHTEIENFTNLFELSFYPINNINKIYDSKYLKYYSKLIDIFSKSSIFDPTAIRSHINNILGKKSNNHVPLKFSYSAFIVDDDKYFLEDFAYFLYRNSVCSILISSENELEILKKLLEENRTLVDFLIFSDEKLKFSKSESGSNVFKKYKEKTIIVTGDPDFQHDDFQVVKKPVTGISDIIKKVKNFKINNRPILNEIINRNINERFSAAAQHQKISYSLNIVVKTIYSYLEKIESYAHFQIVLYDSYKMSRGRNGIQCCYAFENLLIHDIDKFYVDNPHDQIDIRELISEIEVSFFLAFEEKSKLSKPILKSYQSLILKVMTNCNILDRKEPLFLKERLYSKIMSKVIHLQGFNKTFKVLRKAKLSCEMNRTYLSFEENSNEFKRDLYLVKYLLKSLWCRINGIFYRPRGIIFLWLLSLVLFFLLYFYCGMPLNNNFEDFTCPTFWPAVLNSIASTFIQLLPGNTFEMTLFNNEFAFILVRLFHGAFSYFLFGAFIVKYIEKFQITR